MKKTPLKTNLLAELTKRKMDAQKSGDTLVGFSKFKPNKTRSDNRLNVGPSWGPRKGN